MHWGTITWIFFHTLAEKVKEDRFLENREFLLGVVTSMCRHLPCPDCRGHAARALKEHPISRVNTKAQFKTYLFMFHNHVNARKHKKVQGEEMLAKYQDASLPRAFALLKQRFRTTSPRLMLDQMARGEFLARLSEQMRANSHLFNS